MRQLRHFTEPGSPRTATTLNDYDVPEVKTHGETFATASKRENQRSLGGENPPATAATAALLHSGRPSRRAYARSV
jgi:hypothetical protein